MSHGAKSTIASFGGSLRIFQVESGEFSECASYNSGYGKAGITRGRHVSWAGDGQWLTGPVEDSGVLPVFKYENNGKLSKMRRIKDGGVSVATFFSCTNRHLAIGSKTGAVRVWNVRDSKVHQTLCEKDDQPVRFLEVSTDDSYVAVCGPYSERPVVKMFGLTTNRLINTLELGRPGEISDLKFSTKKKNYLGCCTLEGSVVVWDVYKGAAILDLAGTHLGACTGIAFSHINHTLLASVAMNDSLALHDIRKREPILQTSVGASLTSVDMLMSEPAIVMGSRSGHLLLFDLRSAQVVHKIPAHDGPVESVRVALDRDANKKFEDAVVNTPDMTLPTSQHLEISVADICTPPAPLSHLQKSVVGRAVSLMDAISPISPGGGLPAHSTPNIANYTVDSFLDLIRDSPAGTGQPSPSPLNFKAVTLSRIALNGIREEEPEEDVKPDIVPVNNESVKTSDSTPVPMPVEQLPLSFRGAVKEAIREEMVNLREEIIKTVREEMKEVREEVVTVREEIMKRVKEEMQEVKEELSAMIQRNRDVACQIRKDVSDLAFEVRYERVLSQLEEQDSE